MFVLLDYKNWRRLDSCDLSSHKKWKHFKPKRIPCFVTEKCISQITGFIIDTSEKYAYYSDTRWYSSEVIITMWKAWVRDVFHNYSDVIMGAIASQITSLTIVDSTVYSSADQRKHQSSASLAICAGNSPVTGEFPAQMASNAENVSIWWRHHATLCWALQMRFPQVVNLGEAWPWWPICDTFCVINLMTALHHRCRDVIKFITQSIIMDEVCCVYPRKWDTKKTYLGSLTCAVNHLPDSPNQPYPHLSSGAHGIADGGDGVGDDAGKLANQISEETFLKNNVIFSNTAAEIVKSRKLFWHNEMTCNNTYKTTQNKKIIIRKCYHSTVSCSERMYGLNIIYTTMLILSQIQWKVSWYKNNNKDIR